MCKKNGGFYSAVDADSDEEEKNIMYGITRKLKKY